MIHLKCKTEVAVVLVGVANEQGLLMFPSTAKESPGLVFSPLATTPVNLQIIDQINGALSTELDGMSIEVCQEYSDRLKLASGAEATLYLATIHGRSELIQAEWLSLPDHLRSMPKNKNRLTYLRAWQVLTGSLTLNTKVIEAEDLRGL